MTDPQQFIAIISKTREYVSTCVLNIFIIIDYSHHKSLSACRIRRHYINFVTLYIVFVSLIFVLSNTRERQLYRKWLYCIVSLNSSIFFVFQSECLMVCNFYVRAPVFMFVCDLRMCVHIYVRCCV